MTVTDRTRTEIWQGLWDAKRMSRYYLAIGHRHQSIDRVIVLLLLTSGTGAVVALWQALPDWSQAVAGVAVAVTTIYSAIGRHATKAATAHSINVQCDDLAINWRDLLAQVDNDQVDESQAREELNRLDRTLQHITSRSGDVGLATNEKINEASAREAAKELELSYA